MDIILFLLHGIGDGTFGSLVRLGGCRIREALF